MLPAKRPNYSSTHPRPHQYWQVKQRTTQSLDHVQKESTNYSGYVRQPLTDQQVDQLLASSSSNPRECTKLVLSTSAPLVQSVQLSTRDVFRDPTILPYKLESVPTSHSLAKQLAKFATILSGYSQLTRPRLYRVRYNFYVDELGRQYGVTESGEFQFWGGSKFGDGRTERSMTEHRPKHKLISVKLALYAWNGLAGLSSVSMARILVSKAFDFHHVAENLFDIRPESIYPIPSFLHRYIHSQSYSYNDLVNFFN